MLYPLPIGCLCRHWNNLFVSLQCPCSIEIVLVHGGLKDVFCNVLVSPADMVPEGHPEPPPGEPPPLPEGRLSGPEALHLCAGLRWLGFWVRALIRGWGQTRGEGGPPIFTKRSNEMVKKCCFCRCVFFCDPPTMRSPRDLLCAGNCGEYSLPQTLGFARTSTKATAANDPSLPHYLPRRPQRQGSLRASSSDLPRGSLPPS